MFSRFFIDRPIFASVLSIVITLAGGISVFSLPLAQFPSVSPPTVSVTCVYPGASAKDVAEAVAAPIEQQVNGVENMYYMSSSCANDGSYNLTVTFRNGVDLNMAQVMVTNRVNLAIPSLPDVIKQTGVTTLKRSPDILMGVALTSPNARYDQLYMSNYAVLQIKDELARVRGVGDVFLFGQRDYSMRIWLNPAKMSVRNVTTSEVVAALREQSTPAATGSLGQQPIADGQATQFTLSTLGRLSEVEQFENIILRAYPDGRTLRIKDIGRVTLDAKNLDLNVSLDGKPTIFLAIFQMPDANALEVRERVIAKLDELKKSFPEGLDYEVGFDTTPYTRESIREVFRTLRDAIILVAVVVLLFLQNWRSAIIPLVAVPVSIIGTFAVMLAFGFSLNNLTLFGLVLAIGIVVDDAIVVVEAVEHHIEDGKTPRIATITAMNQVSGPVVAVALVLSAVFVPCAFIGGITGMFFRQFALTIAVSTIISAFNSLTLSPALTAVLLKARDKQSAPPLPRLFYVILGGWLAYSYLTPELPAYLSLANAPDGALPAIASVAGAVAGWLVGGVANWILRWFFRCFNACFKGLTGVYTWSIGWFLRGAVIVLLIYGGCVGLTYFKFLMTPRGFIPSQDMGFLMASVQLPDSASIERTERVMKKLQQMTLEHPAVMHATYISGQSFVLNAAASNFGSMFVGLKEYSERRDPKMSSEAVAQYLRDRIDAEIPEAQVGVFGPPPVRGAGRAGGFALMIEDRGDVGPQVLQNETDNITRKGFDVPGLMALGYPLPRPLIMFTVFRANVPQLTIDPDPRECMTKGVRLQDFASTMQVFEGSLYVNDFNKFGRTWQVIVQADKEFRDDPSKLTLLTVRNDKGAMVPLGSLAKVREVNGPLVLGRYNNRPAASINGIAPPGLSSGQVMDLMQRLCKQELPQNMAYEWTDMSFLEQKAGNTAMVIFACAVVMVFLVLAAQYESWTMPLAVILVVPMCLLSAIIGVNYAEMDINIFTQVGFVVLVGLASKNAILIVEFAKKEHETGAALRYATLAACKLRLRPIVMTSLAFILGAVPLLISQGAGAEMRRTLGVAVFSGMLGVTIFGIFLTPVFYFTIGWLGETHLFAASRLRWVSDWVLYFLSLRFLHGPVKFAGKRLTSKRQAPAIPAASHGNGSIAAATSANGSAETNHPGDTASTNGFGAHTESVVEPK
jgi:multidrug efflux pump